MEQINKRTRNSRTVLNNDGSYTTQIFGGDIHYEAEDGKLHPIVTDLYDEADFDVIDEPVAKEGYKRFAQARTEAKTGKQHRVLNREHCNFQALRVPFDAQIPRNFARGYTIGKGKESLTFLPVGASPSQGRVESDKRNCAMYQDVWNDTDVCLEIKPDGVKETITLKTDRAPSSFRFEAKGIDTLQELKLHDAWLMDAEGVKRDVEQTVTEEDGKTYVDLVADVEGLTYPIAIDPTVTADNGTLYEQYSSTNAIGYNNNPNLGNTDSRTYRLLIQPGTMPDLTAYEIISANVVIQQTYVNDTSSLSAEPRRITESWGEGFVGYPSATGDGDPYTSIDQYINGENAVIDATQTIAAWNQGAPFYGIMLVPSGGGAREYDPVESSTIEIHYNSVPTVPTLLSPNGGETWNTEHTIEWEASTDVENEPLTYDIEVSYDNGTSWASIITSATGTSYTYDFSSLTETNTALLRMRAYDGTSYSDWDESDGVFTIQHKYAPDAPGNLSPVGGEPVDRTLIQRLSWEARDQNTNDPQSKFDLEWRVSRTSSWNTITETTNREYWDAPAGTFPHGGIEWRVRTYDQEDLVGPYSPTQTFFAGDKPSAPTITSGSTTDIAQPTIEWSSSGQTAYTLRVLLDGAEIYSYSGGTNKAHTIQNDLSNNTDYTIEVTITNSDGLESDPDSLLLSVSYTPPPKAIITVTDSGDNILIEWENPTPQDTEPNVTGNDVYKREQGGTWRKVAQNLSDRYYDYAVANGQVYEYYVKANGENGSVSESESAVSSITLKGVHLHDISDPTGTNYNFMADSEGRGRTRKKDTQLVQFAGRVSPVAQSTNKRTAEVNVSLLLRNNAEYNAFSRLWESDILCYRDGRGRLEYGVIIEEPIEDEVVDRYRVSFTLNRIDYTEVIE